MHETIEQCLRIHPLFKELGPLDSHLIDSFRVRQYAKGETIYRPGQSANQAYLILDGSIKFEMSTSANQSVFVEIAHQGYLVGELELLSKVDYQTTAIANQDSSLLLIPKETLFLLIKSNGEFAIRFSRQLATNFYFYQILASERETSSLKSKLAILLMSLSIRFGKREGAQVTVAVSHDQLSEMLNASRQRVNMQLNEWQREGLLKCGYGLITLYDTDAFASHTATVGHIISEETITPYR